MLSLANVMKLLSALIACVLLASGCGNNSAKKPQEKTTKPPPIKIGFVVRNPNAVWSKNELKFAQKCADKYGFELLTAGADNGEKVLAVIDSFAAQGAQGFIVQAADVKYGPAIINKAETKNMKVYSIDDQLLGANGEPMTDIPFIGLAAGTIGEKVGNTLYGEFVKRKWDVEDTGVCVITCDDLPTAKDRTEGAMNALRDAGFPEDRIFTCPEESPTTPSARMAASTVFFEHPDIKKWLICSTNDDSVIGAVKVFEAADYKADSIVGVGIGIGGSNAIAEFAKKKPSGFVASCMLSPKSHGYNAAEGLYRWIKNGVQPPMETLTEGTMIFHTNYKQVISEEGLL